MDMEREARGGGARWRGGRRGRARIGATAALALGLALAGAAAAAPVAPAGEDVAGTYRMKGTARVDAAAPFGRAIESRGDAVVRTAGRTVRLRLASLGQACELAASRSGDGALAFEPGQRCAFDLREPDGARGHVDARLRSGSGRLRDRHLSIDLAFELAGKVALQTSQGTRMLGVELPSSWTPDLPVEGAAGVRAEGDRDESRAGEAG
jgi:hypothetical protein